MSKPSAVVYREDSSAALLTELLTKILSQPDYD